MSQTPAGRKLADIWPEEANYVCIRQICFPALISCFLVTIATPPQEIPDRSEVFGAPSPSLKVQGRLANQIWLKCITPAQQCSSKTYNITRKSASAVSTWNLSVINSSETQPAGYKCHPVMLLRLKGFFAWEVTAALCTLQPSANRRSTCDYCQRDGLQPSCYPRCAPV